MGKDPLPQSPATIEVIHAKRPIESYRSGIIIRQCFLRESDSRGGCKHGDGALSAIGVLGANASPVASITPESVSNLS